MEKFFSCDWGTSSFRLKLVESATLTVIASESTASGIAQQNELWKQSNKKPDERIFFYRNYIKEQIQALEKKLNVSLKRVPMILSGMASSNIGMLELPYQKLPFKTDGSDLLTEQIPGDDYFPHDILLISGASTSDDVMRGEETQLVGAEPGPGKKIFIFPGTHSKHISTEKGRALDCKTYMTGEFFELLSGKSILSASVNAGNGLDHGGLKPFEKGVSTGVDKNLLYSSFGVRTNTLFEKMSKEENYYYLSGLLIGSELSDLLLINPRDITVVASRSQATYYREAFRVLHDRIACQALQFVDAEEATIKGQLKIYNGTIGE